MPSKRDSDRSQSPRKKAKYKESKSHRYDRKIRRAKTKARSGKAKVICLSWRQSTLTQSVERTGSVPMVQMAFLQARLLDQPLR